ncbi:MAG: hypothetical protein ACI9FZ_000633 [Bacteroidia bacterium]|jgi:hypothetical protein
MMVNSQKSFFDKKKSLYGQISIVSLMRSGFSEIPEAQEDPVSNNSTCPPPFLGLDRFGQC